MASAAESAAGFVGMDSSRWDSLPQLHLETPEDLAVPDWAAGPDLADSAAAAAVVVAAAAAGERIGNQPA